MPSTTASARPKALAAERRAFDVILAMEVIEHVASPAASCAALA